MLVVRHTLLLRAFDLAKCLRHPKCVFSQHNIQRKSLAFCAILLTDSNLEGQARNDTSLKTQEVPKNLLSFQMCKKKKLQIIIV